MKRAAKVEIALDQVRSATVTGWRGLELDPKQRYETDNAKRAGFHQRRQKAQAGMALSDFSNVSSALSFGSTDDSLQRRLTLDHNGTFLIPKCCMKRRMLRDLVSGLAPLLHPKQFMGRPLLREIASGVETLLISDCDFR